MLFDITDSVRMNELTEVINKVNEIVIHEKNKDALLRRVCDILSSFNDYEFVWIGMLENSRISKVAHSVTNSENVYNL